MTSVENSTIDNSKDTIARLSLTEQAFLQLLLSKGLLVSYEISVFEAEFNGRNVTTKPDFHIINPKKPNSAGKFVEITTSPCEKNKTDTAEDPKQQQRAILRKNGVTHVVLYLFHLANCQRYHPEWDFDVLHRRTMRKSLAKKLRSEIGSTEIKNH